MTVAHTPGPWKFLTGNVLVQDGGRQLHLGTFSESCGLGSAAAPNKALIEAAPLMFEALQKIADMGTTKYARVTVHNDEARIAVAAIAKATGASK